MAAGKMKGMLSDLKRQKRRLETVGRAACKGDPEALRDNKGRIDELTAEIRRLER